LFSFLIDVFVLGYLRENSKAMSEFRDELKMLRESLQSQAKCSCGSKELADLPEIELHPMFKVPDYNFPLQTEEQFNDFEERLKNPKLLLHFVSFVLNFV